MSDENNQLPGVHYRQHPSDFEHGLLCLHVYQNSEEGDIVKFATDNKVVDQFDSVVYNNLVKDWTVYKKNKYKKSENVDSILYVNKIAKQAVLAYRGIDVVKSLTSWDGPLKAALLEVLNGEINYHQVSAYISTKEAVDIARKDGYALSLTGHSFGAWLAELSLYFCHMDFDCNVITGHVKSVTFNSPGSYQQMIRYKSSIINQDTHIDVSAFGMVTYLSAPSPINVCSEHVGKVYRLYPEKTESDSVERFKSRLPECIIKKYTTVKGYFEALFASTHHSLDLMLKAFDPKTGQPLMKQYREVLNWPCIEYTSDASDYGSKAIETIIDLIPGTFAIPKTLKKAISKAIFYLIPSTVYGLLATVTVEFLSGNMKLTQLFETYKLIDKNEDFFDQEEKILKTKKKFSLKYKGHYKIDKDDVNPNKATISNTKGTLEWYLKKIKRFDFGKSNLSEDIVNDLSNLRNKYNLEINNDKMVVISKFCSVENLKDQISYMLKTNADIKNVLLGGMPPEATILEMQADAEDWVKNCSPNNVLKEEGFKNRHLIEKTKKLAAQINKCSKLSGDEIKKLFDQISSKQLINSVYCMNALANCYLYNNHDSENAQEILLSSKKLLEQCVLNVSKVPFSFESLSNKEIYTELSTIKDLPEIYAITVYILARTFLYHGNKADSIPYFELSRDLGYELNLFEGYLSEGRGLLVVIRESLVEQDIENKDYVKAVEKLNECIKRLKEIKSDVKKYKEGYKPGIGENKIVIPADDEYNQIDCSEQLTKCFLQLIRLTEDKIQCAKYAQDMFKLIGSDQSPGMLNMKKLEKIQPKKKSSVRNTFGYTLLKLYDKDIDIKDFKILIDETNQNKDDLLFIEDMFNTSREESRTSDFTKADAYDGLRLLCERKLKQKNLEILEVHSLENLISKYINERDAINMGLKRSVKYESSEVENYITKTNDTPSCQAPNATFDKPLQLELSEFVIKKETTV